MLQASAVFLVSDCLPCHEHKWEKKHNRQHGSGKSEDGDTLFNDGVYFVL